MLVRSDGAVEVHSQPSDKHDPVRIDINANYKKEKEETGKGKDAQ